MDAKTVLVEQMNRTAKAFLKALEEFPADQFHKALPAGGHSAAWHAMHIADWSRILVPNNLEDVSSSERFAYLGWEESDFAKAVYELGSVTEQSSQAEIIAHLKSQLDRAAATVQNADAARLEASVQTPMGERKILAIVLTHIGHVPYHYGQVKINAKQLS